MTDHRRSTNAGPVDEDRNWDSDRLIPASSLSRRGFLGAVGSTLALGLEGCSKPPPEDIVPYVHRPPEVIPGVARHYATSTTRRGYGFGLLVESHEGRPTKIEGHPEHPASIGRTGVREQASILTLYDPERASAYRQGGVPSTFHAFTEAFGAATKRPFSSRRGRGLVLVLEPTASPLVAALVDRLRNRYPEASVYRLSPFSPLARWEGARRAFGEVVEPQYRLDSADVVLALDADFLSLHPMSVPLSRAFAARRKIAGPTDQQNRLYVVESAMTITGGVADHRLAVAASGVGAVAAALLAAVLDIVKPPVAASVRAGRFLDGSPQRTWISIVARDLSRHRGRVAVLVGDRQPPEIHVLGHALASLLDSFPSTTTFSNSAMPEAGGDTYSAQRLLAELDGGDVDTLAVLGGNPAYALPWDARWKDRARKAKERIHLSLFENETSADATWFLPETHYLEQWGDGRAYDGTVSFVQPLIRPLYDGKSVEEVLAALADETVRSGRDLLRAQWSRQSNADVDFDRAIERGILLDTAFPERRAELDWAAVSKAVDGVSVPSDGIEISISEDPRADEGALANNAWLKELPDPIDKTVWGNFALLSSPLAEKLGVESGDVVELRNESRGITIPALVQPGHAARSVTIWFGYGRKAGGSIGRVGADSGVLRTLAAPWIVNGATVSKTDERESIVVTQGSGEQHERPLVLRKTMSEWEKTPDFAERHDAPPATILPDRLHGAPQWGMAIDLNACIGCSTCVVACQAENNIPVVGKANVALSREMHWMRIDRYVSGPEASPQLDFQPMLCQHCEKAPCEYVCPVNATVHSPDGLNEMVYNRCVGTRFCSNNCPYKVRRFNFFSYNQSVPETERMAKNPDVTVRGRGVMEKCTYCVQRIRRAEIRARIDGRPIADGEVRTACEQACPTGAIVFGAVSDPRSAVSREYANSRTYAVLNDVGTRPRTRYLARVSNPNPEIES